jgi:unsaturated rhamnogalacturonyl hydrolase
MTRLACIGSALSSACFLALTIVSFVQPAYCQIQGPGLDRLPVVGDSPEDVPPLATDLSPALDRRSVDKAIRKVGDWQLRRLDSQFDTDWTLAALYTGFMAASDATGDGKYRKAMMKMGQKLDWQVGPRFNVADDLAIGQTYAELYLRYHKPFMIAHLRDRFDAIMKAPEDPEKLTWWWCDALFMGPPVWARLYKATGKVEYLDYMNQDWWKTSGRLYDPQEHLYSRDESYLEKTEANGKKLFWSRGNGWVMAGLVRVLQFMPEDYPERPKYVAQFKEMAAKIASLQGSDGLWRPGLLNAAAYPLPEVSGSAFYTYALAWGVNQNMLENAVYRPVVAKAWKGLLAHIYSDGRLGSIQPVGSAPDKYKPSSSFTFGVGAFLLAGSEVHHLAEKR